MIFLCARVHAHPTRFLGKKYGLTPADPVHEGQCDALAEAAEELITKRGTILRDPKTTAEEKKEFFDVAIPAWLSKFDVRLLFLLFLCCVLIVLYFFLENQSLLGDQEFFFENKLTYGDIAMFWMISDLDKLFPGCLSASLRFSSPSFSVFVLITVICSFVCLLLQRHSLVLPSSSSASQLALASLPGLPPDPRLRCKEQKRSIISIHSFISFPFFSVRSLARAHLIFCDVDVMYMFLQ